MADTDPPNKVDDGESPADGDVHAPDAHAFVEQPADGQQKPLQNHKADEHAQNPTTLDRPLQNDSADLLVQRGKGMPRLNDRCFLFADFDFGWFGHVVLSYQLSAIGSQLRPSSVRLTADS